MVGQAEGAHLDEEGLLGGLRKKGMITYPSPLLAFLERYPDLFKEEVLPRLDPARAHGARDARHGVPPRHIPQRAPRWLDLRGPCAALQGANLRGRACLILPPRYTTNSEPVFDLNGIL